MRGFRKLLALHTGVIALWGALSSPAVFSQPPAPDRRQAESDLQTVQQELKLKTDTLEQLTRQESQAQAKARVLREEMELLAEVRRRLQAKHHLLNENYTASDQLARRLEEGYELRSEVLARTLASVYRSTAISGQRRGESAGLVQERRRRWASLVTSDQVERLEVIAESLAVWENRRADLAHSRREVELAAAEKERQQTRTRRLADRSEREAFAYRQQRDRQLGDIEHLQREALILAEMIDRLSALQRLSGAVDYDFPSWRGRLRWPLAGTVKSTVGTRVDPRYGTTTTETGMFISGSRGQSVVGAADGEVVYAGRQRGLGNLVIIGHGGGYFSVFAHLGEIAVFEGQVVLAGDHLGTVGDSHPRYGTGVLVELRHDREVLDPLEWLR